jgi:hypothetical protein
MAGLRGRISDSRDHFNSTRKMLNLQTKTSHHYGQNLARNISIHLFKNETMVLAHVKLHNSFVKAIILRSSKNSSNS